MGKAVVMGKTVLNTRFTSVVAAAVVEAVEVPAAEVQEDHLAAAVEVGVPVEAVEAAAVAEAAVVVVVQEAHHLVQVLHQAAVAPAAPAVAALAASVRNPASQVADITLVVLQNLTSPASQVPEELRLSL
jgi:hypothetical protein